MPDKCLPVTVCMPLKGLCVCVFFWQEQIYTGTDISTLLKEVQKAQDIINKIKEMRRGLLGTALVSVMDEVSA